jgi:hypothetical protein
MEDGTGGRPLAPERSPGPYTAPVRLAFTIPEFVLGGPPPPPPARWPDPLLVLAFNPFQTSYGFLFFGLQGLLNVS